MNTTMLRAAQFYHDEGLNVIPVVYRDKRPALPSWTEYQSRPSTAAEVQEWFGNGQRYNIGIVHGPQRTGQWYALLDIDNDAGIYADLRATWPGLCGGRVTQSGSRAGYHIHLLLDADPLPGRNGYTWHTPQGDVNLRAGSGNQTVMPPSLHPSGHRYRFLHKGPIAHAAPHELHRLRAWLDELDPPAPERPAPPRPAATRTSTAPDLRAAVLDAWDTWRVLDAFGIAGIVERRRDEAKVRERGGLFVKDDGTWYCFTSECGGGPVEAWQWCRWGLTDRARYRETLVEMAQAAGVDVAAFYRRGDEQVYAEPPQGDRQRWTDKARGLWERWR